MTKTARTTTVSVRIDKPTAAEWREKAEASDLSLSDWIRGAIDTNQQTHLPTPRKRAVRVRDTSHDADPVLMRQLAGMSNNLNQIARALNECRLIGSGVVSWNRRNFRHPSPPGHRYSLGLRFLWSKG